MREADPARIGALNAGIQMLWGAILAVSLQARSIELTPEHAVAGYATLAAWGATVAMAVQIAAATLADRRGPRHSRLPFYAVGTLLALPALAWFYFAPNFAQLVAAFIALQFAVNVILGAYQAAIPDYVPERKRGVASAWTSGYQALGNAAGLLIAGFVHTPWIVVASLGFALAVTFGVTYLHLRAIPAFETPLPPARTTPLLLALMLSRGLINLGFFTLLGFLLFFIRDSLGIALPADTRVQTALVFLTFTLAGIAGAALSGRPIDRYDKRAIVSVCIGVMVAALLVLGTASSLAIVYVAAFVAGAAWGGFVSADWALAAVILDMRRMATSLGIWNIATAGPQILAPLITAPLVVAIGARAAGAGPRAAVVLAALECAAGAALIWRLPRA